MQVCVLGVEKIQFAPSGKLLPHSVHPPIRDEYYDHVTSKQPTNQNTSKLNQLEKLQYELTKQVLLVQLTTILLKTTCLSLQK